MRVSNYMLGKSDTPTARELETLRLVAQGFTNREIADRLSVSEKTAQFYVSALYHKSGISPRNRVKLALWAPGEAQGS